MKRLGWIGPRAMRIPAENGHAVGSRGYWRPPSATAKAGCERRSGRSSGPEKGRREPPASGRQRRRQRRSYDRLGGARPKNKELFPHRNPASVATRAACVMEIPGGFAAYTAGYPDGTRTDCPQAAHLSIRASSPTIISPL